MQRRRRHIHVVGANLFERQVRLVDAAARVYCRQYGQVVARCSEVLDHHITDIRHDFSATWIVQAET